MDNQQLRKVGISYKEYDNIEEILNKAFKVQRPSL